MYYLRAFVFSIVIVVNLSLTGALNFGRNQMNSNMPESYSDPQETYVNIGNGVHRKNVVVIDQGTNNGGNNAQRGRAETDQIPTSRFNIPTQNVDQQNSGPPRPSPWQSSAVNNIGNGVGNRNTVVTSRRTSPSSGTNVFNVGYGPDNHNKVFENGRPVVPAPSVNHGRHNQNNDNSKDRNSGGFTPNTQNTQINHIIVNGKAVQPDSTDGYYDTYHLNGQTIHVMKQETQSPASSNTLLQNLYSINESLEQIKAKLRQEAAKLNVKL